MSAAPVSAWRRARGLVRVTHPLPSLMYVLAVGLFGVLASLASHRPANPGVMARVLLGVWCTQMAIGALNDYMDRAADASCRPEKPLVRGDITPAMALGIVGAATLAMLLLLAPLGPGALVLGICIEGLGLAYDLRFKGTWVSGLLYAIYFPLIPLLAWVAFGRYQPFLPWLVLLGAPLGVAMNVANSLPDLENDLAAGVRGLPHLLGLRHALLITWLIPPVVAALMLALAITGIVPARGMALLAGVVAAVGTSTIAVGLYRARPGYGTLRTTFYVQALGVLGVATAWLAAVAF